MRVVLLPGMDGSGELFRAFAEKLSEFEVEVVRYPTDHALGRGEFLGLVRAGVPGDEPFVLVAESFSTPLAIRYAAGGPSNLKGLVLCAGFCTSPVRGLWRDMVLGLAPLLSHVRLPGFAVRWLLLGGDAPEALVEAVQAAVSWVEPRVMASRLREALACDVRAELGQVEVPVLYLQPVEDRLVGPESLQEMLGIKAGATTVVDGPHMLLQREPRLCAEVVTGFVEGLGRAEETAA